MTKTGFFLMFQTQYTVFSISYQQAVVVEHWDFQSKDVASASRTLGFSKHWDFQSKDVASVYSN
jgi:hypothetical protein